MSSAAPVVPNKLVNTFNKMLLLTTNLLPDEDLPLPQIDAKETEKRVIEILTAEIEKVTGTQQSHINSLILAYEQRLNSTGYFNETSTSRKECIDYDLISLNGTPGALTEVQKIAEVAVRFYKYALLVHFHSLHCIKLSQTTGDTGQGVGVVQPVGGVLFENPLFNAYDSAFHGADGIHDAEPRGDMTTGDIVPKKGKGTGASGGWTLTKSLVGNDSRDRLISAIRQSSIKPTETQTDDIARNIKWDSLNKTTGHTLLDPTNVDRVICNVILPEKITVNSAQLVNSGNRYKIIEVQNSKEGVEKSIETVRKIYGIDALSNNFAISDCAGPDPSELQALVASSVTIDDKVDDGEDDDDGDDDDDQEGGAIQMGGAKNKPKKKKMKQPRVISILSGILDSSSGKDTGGISKLQQINSLNNFKEFVTFLLPHTRWQLNTAQKQKAPVVYIYQRVVIDFTKPGIQTYKMRFEAWITRSENPTQTFPTEFLSTSNFFELLETDKCPGVNETIRYILSIQNGKKSVTNDFAEKYAQKMFPTPKDYEDSIKKIKKTKNFFSKFSKAYEEFFAGLPQDPPVRNALGDATLFKLAFLFRQKTMGDFLRLADTAYLNEILWTYNNKLGVSIEGTCDGYSGIKAMASNNCPVFLCGAGKFGSNYTMYSSLTLDAEAAERAAKIEQKSNYIEKTRKLKENMDKMRIEYYKYKDLKIQEFLEQVYSGMKVTFSNVGKSFLEEVVVNKILDLNNDIIQFQLELDEAKRKDETRNIKTVNYKLDNTQHVVDEIAKLVENALSILSLFLLMNAFIKNWLIYCDNFLNKYGTIVDDLIQEIENDSEAITDETVNLNTKIVNSCNSLFPSTKEIDKIKVFLESCNKYNKGLDWSKSIEPLTFELLTLTVKKDYTINEPKLKKMVDKGVPDLLAQEKDTTVSYISLTNYVKILEELQELFGKLDIPAPDSLKDIPRIDLTLNSYKLNQLVVDEFVLWFSQPILVTVPQVAEVTPVEPVTPVPQVTPVTPVEPVTQVVEEKLETKEEISVKKQKVTKLNKFLSAARTIVSCNRAKRYLLRSFESVRTRSFSRRVGGGNQVGGSENVVNSFEEIENLANIGIQSLNSEKIVSEDYVKNIGDYFPLLYGNSIYNTQQRQTSQSRNEIDKVLDRLFESPEFKSLEDTPDDYLFQADLNDVMSSSLKTTLQSFDEFVVSLDTEGNEEIDSLVTAIDEFNGSLIDDVSEQMHTSLNKLSPDYSDFLVNFFTNCVIFKKDDNNPYYDSRNIDVINSLLSILFKFSANVGTEISENVFLKLRYTFDSFLYYEKDETFNSFTLKNYTPNDPQRINGVITFKESFILKTQKVFSTVIAKSELFKHLFDDIIPSSFFKKDKIYGDYILRKRVIYFVIQDTYGVTINADIIARNWSVFELLSISALLYSDNLLISAVAELYFKTNGTAQQLLPQENGVDVVEFYKDYYIEADDKRNFPIPVEEYTLPFLLLLNCKDGERSPLITSANLNEVGSFSVVCKDLIIKPLLTYFWSEYFSESMKSKIVDSLKFKLIMKNRTIDDENLFELLTSYFYCYLFGTCKNDSNHNGIIMDDVPGEILSLGLVQYTTMGGSTYLSFSAAELQSIIQQFMSLSSQHRDSETITKTPQEWITWAQSLPPEQVKLPGRPENTQELMSKFMNQILGGVVSNYKNFTKKQKEELEIDGLEDERQADSIIKAKSRTLMELYNIVLYKVATVNIENINVTKVSLLSDKIGLYLSNPEEFSNDINSSIDLEEPEINFYKFFTDMFLVKSDLTLESDEVTNFGRLVENIISEYKRSARFKEELKEFVSGNDVLISNINSIINKQPNSLNTYFGLLLKELTKVRNKATKELENRYILFLNNLIGAGSGSGAGSGAGSSSGSGSGSGAGASSGSGAGASSGSGFDFGSSSESTSKNSTVLTGSRVSRGSEFLKGSRVLRASKFSRGGNKTHKHISQNKQRKTYRRL
jgi:hypothetical protein